MAEGVIEIHCPFGCTLADCDEHGYCRHLLGFTNDGKVYEPIRPHVNGITGRPTGKKFTDGRKLLKVEKGDRIVNPESPQIDQGVTRMRKAWVSSRIYRQNVPAPAPLPDDDELETLTRPEPAKV